MTPGEQLVDDLKFLMSTAAGRRVFAYQLREYGVFQSSFNRAGGNQHSLEFFEGMRHAGLMLYTDLEKHCFNELLILMREARPNETQESGDHDPFSA